MKPFRKHYLHVRSNKQVSSMSARWNTQNFKHTRSMIVDSWIELRKFR